MTRQGAERALSELEAYARRDYSHSTDVQGRMLDCRWLGDAEYSYVYKGHAVLRGVALTLLENR